MKLYIRLYVVLSLIFESYINSGSSGRLWLPFRAPLLPGPNQRRSDRPRSHLQTPVGFAGFPSSWSYSVQQLNGLGVVTLRPMERGRSREALNRLD